MIQNENYISNGKKNRDDITQALEGRLVTGFKMSDGEPVKGYVIGHTPFTYILPQKIVQEACCTGQQQVEIHGVAERVLAHT